MITEKGLLVPSFDETKKRVEDRFKSYFGENLDVSPNSPTGRMIDLFASLTDDVLQGLQALFDATSPDNAQGVYLDNLAALKGFARKPGQKASGAATVTGVAGTSIPSGFLVQDQDDNKYQTLEIFVVEVSGEVLCNFFAVEAKKLNDPTELQISTPVKDINSVSNFSNFFQGQDAERDYIFRTRIQKDFSAGTSTDLALRSKIISVSSVSQCLVVSNRENSVVDGMPAKSVNVFIYPTLEPDSEIEVAEIIFNNIPVGIESSGSETFSVTDLSGYTHEIKFSYSEEDEIDVVVNIVKNNRFPTNGIERIGDIVEYFFDGMTDEERSANPEIADKITNPVEIGSSLNSSDLIYAIKTVPGIKTIEVLFDGVDIYETPFNQFPVLNGVTINVI
jgi:uncharacterized phage protein gp47/JayE